jgi:hypothetical protein
VNGLRRSQLSKAVKGKMNEEVKERREGKWKITKA